MEEVFPPYHVFINHRGPDVKKTLASLIYHALEGRGLRVFFDKQELEAGDSLTPAIKSAICSASVQIAIFSKTYAKSAWCLNELLWMLDSHHSIIIPIFYDIQPSDLRYVDKGAYACSFQKHRNKGRVTIQQMDSWISALNKVSEISGVVISTEEDDLGERLKEIVEIVSEKVTREELDVGKYPVGLRQAAEDFEREVLNQSEISGIKVVGIVGLGGSGKSTLVTQLYNSKRSHFQRSCFLSKVSKSDLPSLQQTLLRDLLCDHKLRFQDMLRGRSMLRDRLRGLRRVLIVFDDIDNTEQIENLLFVKDVVGDGSLILVTSRDQTLLASSNIQIYNIKLLDSKDAQELFRWHAFGHSEPLYDLQDMVQELVGICSGFPLALKVLAGQLHNERDPRKWKQQLESLRKQLPNNLLKQIVNDSYKSLDIREREAFLDIAHFFIGEDADLVERVFDGLNGSGFQCLNTLRQKCLVEFESADIILPRTISAEFLSWRIGVWRRAKGSFQIRMHDLVRDLAIQIGRNESSLRVCCRNDTMIPPRVSDVFSDVRGIRRDDANWLKERIFFEILRNPNPQATRVRRDDDDQLPLKLRNICGLKLLAFQNSTLLQRFHRVSGDLIWFRLRQFKDTPTSSPLSQRSLSNLIPSTLSLRSLRVLEVHGVNPLDFCNLFDDHEAPSQLRELTVTCTKDNQMSSLWTAGPSTPGYPKLGLPSKTLDSLLPGLLKLGLPSKTLDSLLPGYPKLVLPSKTSHSLRPSVSSTASSTITRLASASDLLQRQINLVVWLWEWLGYRCWKSLVKMVLQNIEGMITLPFQFDVVRDLRHVDLSGCSDLEVLPDSFTEELSELQYLALRNCRKLVLRSLGKISKLEYLDCEGCSMLNELPRGTEVQKSLKHLNVLCTGLTELPQHLEQLKNLEELHIGSSKLTELPSSLYALSRLTDLTLLGCTNLLYIDNSIEKLVNLERFRIYNCGLKALPERIAWMKMKILDVQDCPLNHLVMGVDSGNMPPGSSQAQKSIDHGVHHNRSSCLTNLIIRDTHISGIHIPQAESLFPKLEIVDLSSNIYLREISSLPGSLITLNLLNCQELRTLACLSTLARLKVLDISGCVKLESVNVEGLSSIEVIKADKCWKMQSIQGLGKLQKLSYFQISVHCLSRSSCTDFMTCAPNISTAVLSGTTKKMLIAEMDRVASRFEGVEVQRILQSNQLELNVKLKGAVFLYLIMEYQNYKIEGTFFGHVYTAHSSTLSSTHSSAFNYAVHILMWTEDSEVYKDFISSSDKAQDFSLLNERIEKGWIIEAKDSQVCKEFIRYLFFEGYI